MKLVVLFIWVNSFTLIAQLSDTTCIKERWISLERTIENASLFESNITFLETSLIGKIKELADEGKLELLHIESEEFRDQHYDLMQDSIFLKRNDVLMILDHRFALYEIDENAEITERLIMPAYHFALSNIIEIRIKEIKRNDEFIIEKFGFCHAYGESLVEFFWIDAIEFQRLLTKTDFAWYDVLFNQKYRGFQYMQTSCYK